MQILFTLFLILHILGGALGLFTGTINLFRRKGDRKHKLIGRIFTYAMLMIGFSALILAVLHPNHFLFIVGIFTIYLVATGNRYIYLKLLGFNQRPTILDWVITVGMLVVGIVFIGLGLRQLLAQHIFGIVFIVFGGLGLFFVKTDIENYKGMVQAKNYWLLAHLQRMTGSYIAALTAFLVVNAKHFPIDLPGVIFWLLPTIILTPMIIKWTNEYRVE